MADVEIYVLRHPVTDEIRYVGKALDSEKRLRGHIANAHARDFPSCRWIRKLLNQGLSPKMEVVCKCSHEDWEETERSVIAVLRQGGARLLNVAPGGDQPFQTREQRQRAGRAAARNVHDDPERRKLWELKRKAGEHLRWLRKNRDDERVQRFIDTMRFAAMMRPDTFGSWLNLQ